MSDDNANLPSADEINSVLADHHAIFNHAFFKFYEIFNGKFKDRAGRPDALPFKASRHVQEWMMYSFANMILQIQRAQADTAQDQAAISKAEDKGAAAEIAEDENPDEEVAVEEE